MTEHFRNILLMIAMVTGSVAHGAEITPFADALIWRASEETSSVWASVITEGPSGSPDPANVFEAKGIKFDWSTGFRVGAAITPENSQWDWEVSVTHFATSQGASVPEGDHLVIPEFFSGFVSGDAVVFTSASIDWKLSMTSFDVEAGHAIELTERLQIRPAFGLKIASTQQSINSNWASEILGVTAVENVRQDFFGVGPTFGIGGAWLVPKTSRLRVIGDCSAALLYGVWNVEDNFRRTDAGAPLFSYEAFTTSMNDSQLGTVMISSFVGLEWAYQGRIHITARAGYEMQWWANQQRLLTFQQLPMHGDLTLQGATCGLAFSY